jgi:primosomal protein N' (replication factor Y)
MVTKGHDFPGVTLVGVVLADGSMHFPDFRSGERTFQLLEQVAGRAGRGERPGRVLIQTFVPGHEAVTCARDHDYARFFAVEREARLDGGYPPFGRLALLRVDGTDEAEVIRVAGQLGEALEAAARGAPEEAGVRVLGPAEAPIGRLRGRTRWQLLVRVDAPQRLHALLSIVARVPLSPSVRASIDVDPMSTL